MNQKNNLALLFVLLNCILNYTNAQNRIIRGEVINISDSPHSVAIFYKREYLCGGSIVSIKSIVTVGHCVYGKDKIDLYVLAGITNIDTEPGDPHCVEKIIPHDDSLDIAVVKVFIQFELNNEVNIIKLCKDELKPGKSMRISGWGSSSVNSEFHSPLLQAKDVKIVQCRNAANLVTTTLTAGDNGADMGARDIGAGGVFKGRLCAVAQLIVANSPDLYIDVSSPTVLNFIKKQIECE